MICKPEEADQFKCCVQNKQCDGAKCMAWRLHFIEDMSVDPPKIRGLSMPRRHVASGKGYCGVAYK